MGRYLAIDIGTDKGRHILGQLENGRLVTEEIHSFDNRTCEREGEECWDFKYLFDEIKKGLRICFEALKLPIFVAITAWDNDFVLLDEEDKIIGSAAVYREETADTIKRLTEIKEKHPDYLEKAQSFLTIPDYLNFLLTGTKRSEYFKAFAAQLVDPATKAWDEELLQKLGFPRRIFMDLNEPTAVLGTLRLEINEEIGYDCIILQSLSGTAGAKLFGISAKTKGEGTDEAEPPAAAVISNLLLHLICSHELKDFQAARECVKNTYKAE
jgi:rhamnulokinase